jgi:hypothetical protein
LETNPIKATVPKTARRAVFQFVRFIMIIVERVAERRSFAYLVK